MRLICRHSCMISERLAIGLQTLMHDTASCNLQTLMHDIRQSCFLLCRLCNAVYGLPFHIWSTRLRIITLPHIPLSNVCATQFMACPSIFDPHAAHHHAASHSFIQRLRNAAPGLPFHIWSTRCASSRCPTFLFPTSAQCSPWPVLPGAKTPRSGHRLLGPRCCASNADACIIPLNEWPCVSHFKQVCCLLVCVCVPGLGRHSRRRCTWVCCAYVCFNS